MPSHLRVAEPVMQKVVPQVPQRIKTEEISKNQKRAMVYVEEDSTDCQVAGDKGEVTSQQGQGLGVDREVPRAEKKEGKKGRKRGKVKARRVTSHQLTKILTRELIGLEDSSTLFPNWINQTSLLGLKS